MSVAAVMNPFDDLDHAQVPSSSNHMSEDNDYDDMTDPDNDNNDNTEASWQYLGDLPYRRIPIYSHVQWQCQQDDSSTSNKKDDDPPPPRSSSAALTWYPTQYMKPPAFMGSSTPEEMNHWYQSVTHTHVTAVPHGGPVATMTVPLTDPNVVSVPIRILTTAGHVLAQISHFPPAAHRPRYSAVDVLGMGFTSRTTLIVVLQDSLCFTYNLQGGEWLPPFYICTGGSTPLIRAHIYSQGVAVLTQNQTVVLAELLDEHDDPAYAASAHLTSTLITSKDSLTANNHNPFGTAMSTNDASNHAPANQQQNHSVLITVLPTSEYATQHYCTFCTLAVLDRHRTTSGHVEVFVSTSDNSVVVCETVNRMTIVDVDCRNQLASPIVDMVFAPNGRFLACFTQASVLTVISTSFETKVLDFDTSEGSRQAPLQMEWCGEDSVVLHWRGLGVLMVGPYGDWLRFPFAESNLYILPEVDCCRVITDSSVEILQRVPPVTAQLLRIGSIEPAAMLVDAADAFYAGSRSSSNDNNNNQVDVCDMDNLDQAVTDCLEAGTKEFDIDTQKRLLRAASYGMHFSYHRPENDENTSSLQHVQPTPLAVQFVESARKLRILNRLRHPNVGWIATSAQFDAMTPTGIVARLIALRRPALACSIAQYLDLPKSVQILARASKAAAYVAVAQGLDSQIAETAKQIIMQDSTNDNRTRQPHEARGAYATVAMAATQAGRPGVANLLLLLETSVSDKVPALLSTGAYSDAMAVATKARDMDFIFKTLMEYEKSCVSNDVSKAQATFLGTVVTKFTTEGFHTLRRYLQTTSDVKSVTNLLIRAQKFAGAGTAMAQRALQEHDIREKQGLLSESARIFGLGKDTALHKASTDDYAELLRDQEILRTKHNSTDVAPPSTSVADTISSLIKHGAVNIREQHRLFGDADKMAKKYRIPEKRYWHLQVNALAGSRQWSNLRILAESRAKSPIGFKPFARAAIRGKQPPSEVLKYIDRVSATDERYELFCEACLWKRALEEAFQLKDTRRVVNVKSLCNSPELQAKADEILHRLMQ